MMYQKIKNSILLSIMSLLVVVAVAQPQSKTIDKIIATVGSEIVLKSALEGQIASLKSQGILVDEDERCRLFEDLLYQHLLINQAALDSVEVSDAQVEGEMDRRLSFFIQQVGSEERLEQYYKKTMVEIKEELRTIVKEQLIAQTMQQNITGNVKVTPEEVKNFYNGLPEDSIPFISSEVEVAQIIVNAKQTETAKNQAKERLQGIKERIENGEQFSTLAVLYSEDPGSAKKGGELGFLGRGDLVSEYATEAFNLKNTNQLSEIIESKFGFHLIQLIERRGQKINTRHILIKIKVEEEEVLKAKELADSVYQRTMTDTLTFGELALKYSDDEQTKNSEGLIVNPQTGTSVFNIDEVDPQVFYLIDNMEPGDVSQPVPTEAPDGTKGYKIVKLLSKTEEHLAKFETDYLKIQELALEDKQYSARVKWVQKKLAKTFVKIADDYKGCLFENKWIN